MSIQPYPSFDELPLTKDGPGLNAWGLWGPGDQLGMLNHLTDETVAKAAKEQIQTGQRVSLNWSMAAASYPRFPRKPFEIKTINKAPLKHAHDDEWSFNSQCSSQWDGFRHYAYQDKALYYMGRTADEFAKSPVPNGVQHISMKGIAGRAVFIDWYAWALKKGIVVHGMTAQGVPLSQLLDALHDQGMSADIFRPGDILVIRFGYTLQYDTMDPAERARLDKLYQTEKPENIGVEPSRALLRFLWDNQFAAVCGDSRSFEVWPCRALQWHLHEHLLAGWGLPIGELFDLEALSAICAKTQRYTFFLSSSPMNAPGAVASPPNALAFF